MVDITIEQVTDGEIETDPNGVLSWEGSGVFDKLIKSVNENLDIQYRNQRITGSDYAMVYSNSLIAVMQQAIEFVLRKDLTEAQIDDMIASTAIREAELELRRELTEAQITEINANIAFKESELELRRDQTEAQIEEINANIALKEVEKKTMYTQRIKLDKEAALLGLDSVVKTVNVTPETIYTPKYEE